MSIRGSAVQRAMSCGVKATRVALHNNSRIGLERSPPLPQYDDPSTWPPHWKAADLEHCLRPFLLNQEAPPNYVSLMSLVEKGDLDSVKFLLRAFVRPPPPKVIDIDDYLGAHVNNVVDKAAMPLQERAQQLEATVKALEAQPGSEKRKVVFSYSPRGTGKTQFIKHFVATHRADALKCGRVIVRCCDKASHESHDKSRSPWFAQVMSDELTQRNDDAITSSTGSAPALNSTDEGFCHLIQIHVEKVTGRPQDRSHYTNPTEAYKTWMSETELYFEIPRTKKGVEPLIILDTCECLAELEHKSLVHKTSGKRYTLLEAFCLAVPSPFGILVMGCNANIDATDPVFLTMANITNIGPLPLLSERGYHKALESSWNAEVDMAVRKPLFYWTGGSPRLLRLAHVTHKQDISLAQGSFDAFSRCFGLYKDSAKAKYPVQPKWFPHTYTCLLASSTKAKVKSTAVIPVNPAWRDDTLLAMTYDEATTQSIGAYNPLTNRFVVPPITFDDDQVTRSGAPILPSQLHPFLTAEVAAHFGAHVGIERERLFERAFLYAVYARYLLAYWENSTNPWVPLRNVFEGAVHPQQVPIVERYEVNLSSGVTRSIKAVEHAVTYVGGAFDHGAYIWCRDKKAPEGGTFAVPLQLRPGGYQTARRLPSSSSASIPLSLSAVAPPLLLSVYQEFRDDPTLIQASVTTVAIDAGSMSSIGWLRSASSKQSV